MDYRTVTNEEALAAWDAGDPVWSASMGGMGQGYEQCIQLMAFEMFRAMLASPPDNWDAFNTEDKPENRARWERYRQRIEQTPAVIEIVRRLEPSGAQFGAAVNLASVFARNGYAKGMEMVPPDRRIQVKRGVPTLNGEA